MPSLTSAKTPRLIAFGAIAVLLLVVGSGQFYRMTGEGRVIGLGEEPLWFPHEAARFAGEPGMPDRFLSFHNGHASLFEYYHGPERKVYTDPRLEVAGPALFQRYLTLQDRLVNNQPGWEAALDEMGRPSILVDHEHSSGVGARSWRVITGSASGSMQSPQSLCTTRTPRLSRSMPSISPPGISVPIRSPRSSRASSPS